MEDKLNKLVQQRRDAVNAKRELIAMLKRQIMLKLKAHQ